MEEEAYEDRGPDGEAGTGGEVYTRKGRRKRTQIFCLNSFEYTCLLVTLNVAIYHSRHYKIKSNLSTYTS